MSGDQIKVDFESLKTLKTDLQTILDEFSNADSNSETTANSTGHDTLADRVRSFSSTWSIKREEMTTNVQNMQQMIAQIVETFTKVDNDFKGSLSDAGQTA